jgi:hypothetical protein
MQGMPIGENLPMNDLSNRKPLLTARGLADLQNAKQQIVDAAAGKVPEGLVLATALAAVRLARREATPQEVLSERVVELVRQSLKALAQQKGKPETALLLQKRENHESHQLHE